MLLVFPWILVLSLAGIGTTAGWFIHPAFLLFFVYSLYLFLSGLTRIPADPPHKGVLTIWGKKTSYIIEEGIKLFLPSFPWWIEAIEIEMTKRNVTITISDVPCKHISSGKIKTEGMVSATVIVSFTWMPDEDRLGNFIKIRKDTGVESILTEKIGDEVRQMGREHDWQGLIFATDKINYTIIHKVTGDPINASMDEKAIDDYLKNLALNGSTDIIDLGVRIFRVNVSKVEVEKKVRDSADKLAVEEQERRAEVFEVETELEQAEKLYKKYEKTGEKKTMAECVHEIRMRKAQRDGKGVTTLEIPGLREAASAVATILKGGTP